MDSPQPEQPTTTTASPAVAPAGGGQTETAGGGGDRTTFHANGAPPPVGGSSAPGPRSPTASERGFGAPAAAPPSTAEIEAANNTLFAAAYILATGSDQKIPAAPAAYAPALRQLLAGITGERVDRTKLTATERLAEIHAARIHLGHPIQVMNSTSSAWLQKEVLVPLAQRESALRVREAEKLVEDNTKHVEVGSDPHEQGKALQIAANDMIGTLRTLYGWAKTATKDDGRALEKQADDLIELKGLKGIPKLDFLMENLHLISGYLSLTDKELQEKQKHIEGHGNAFATYSELVAAGLNMLGSAVTLTHSYAAIASKITGNMEGFVAQNELVKAVQPKIEAVLGAVELVHNVSVLFDKKASGQAKADATVGAVTGAINLTAQGVELFGSEAAAETAGALAFTVTTPIIIAYAEAKYFIGLYGESLVGLQKLWMSAALDNVRQRGTEIANLVNQLETTERLIHDQPAKRAALQHVHIDLAHRLQGALASFVDACSKAGYAQGSAAWIGNYPILKELFAPIAQYRDAKTLADLGIGAKLALEKIVWALTNGDTIATDQTMNKHLKETQGDVAKQEEARKKAAAEKAEQHEKEKSKEEYQAQLGAERMMGWRK